MQAASEDLRAAEDIRNLIGRYCDAIARLDARDIGACWVRDGVWTVFDEDVAGRAAIIAAFRELASRMDWVVQHASSPALEVDGSRATGIWQIVEYGRRRGDAGLGSGQGMIHVGRYVDAYEQDEDGWRFATRRFETIHYSGLRFE